MKKIDRPASVLWSVAGPGGKPMPPNARDFATLREALLFIRTLPQGSRSKLAIHAGGKRYGPADLATWQINRPQSQARYNTL